VGDESGGLGHEIKKIKEVQLVNNQIRMEADMRTAYNVCDIKYKI